MKITILTLFPEMFQTPLNHGIFKRATEKGVVVIEIVNFRDFAKDKHRKVDDYPYGGGAGMILKPEPIFSALEDVEPGYVVYLSPQGKILNQNKVEELAQKSHLILLCGHYEGVDERVRTALVDEEISIGDYILSGGEIPALVLTDAVVRLLPDVLGNKGSLKEEEEVTSQPSYLRAGFIGRVFQDPLLGTSSTMSIEENLILAFRRGEKKRLKKAIGQKERDFFRERLKILGLGLENRLSTPVGLPVHLRVQPDH